jgi:hypothetical protein
MNSAASPAFSRTLCLDPTSATMLPVMGSTRRTSPRALKPTATATPAVSSWLCTKAAFRPSFRVNSPTRYVPNHGWYYHLDAPQYTALVILNIQYNDRRLNDSTAYS